MQRPVEIEEQGKEGKVYLMKSAAERIARVLLKVDTSILPVFRGVMGAAAEDGKVASFVFTVQGKNFWCCSLNLKR